MSDIPWLKIYLDFPFLSGWSTNILTLDLRHFAYWPQLGFLPHLIESSSAQTFCSSNLNILSFHKLAVFFNASLYHLQMLFSLSGKIFPRLLKTKPVWWLSFQSSCQTIHSFFLSLPDQPLYILEDSGEILPFLCSPTRLPHLGSNTFSQCFHSSTLYITLLWFLLHWVVIYLICFLCPPLDYGIFHSR